ncbi:hypothetical protein D3C74_294960 [compost metagenome]
MYDRKPGSSPTRRNGITAPVPYRSRDAPSPAAPSNLFERCMLPFHSSVCPPLVQFAAISKKEKSAALAADLSRLFPSPNAPAPRFRTKLLPHCRQRCYARPYRRSKRFRSSDPLRIPEAGEFAAGPSVQPPHPPTCRGKRF